MKLVEYSPPAAQPSLWKRVRTSKRSLLLFTRDNPVRELCRWITSPSLGQIIPQFHTRGGTSDMDRRVSSGSVNTAISSIGNGGSVRGSGAGGWGGGSVVQQGGIRKGSSSKSGGREQSARTLSCWDKFIFERPRVHRFARYLWELAMSVAVLLTMIGVSFDVELLTGRMSRAGMSTEWLVVENIVLVMFCLEVLMLCVADGLFFLPNAYLRKPVHCVDFVVTVVSVVRVMAFDGERWDDSRAICMLRAVRGLRALRLIKVRC